MYDEAFQKNITESDIDTLLCQVKNGNEAALEEIVVRNMPLVKSVVRHFLNRGCEYDDLCQLGTIGLIKAARNYDFNFDVKFSTYAVPLIMGEIKRFLRDDGIIKISRTVKENAKYVNEAREKLFDLSSREPTVGEITEATGLSYEDVVEALGSSVQVASIYDVVAESDNSDLLLMDKITDEKDYEATISTKLLMRELLQSLEDEDKQIILLRYFKGLTQCDVAKKLGLSQVQVSRKEKKILMQFRKQCG